MFAFSFTMYCSVSLRKSRGGLPRHTYCQLEKFEKLPGIAEGLDGVLHQVLLNTKF